MGVGPGYAIAAAMYCRDYFPTKRVVCVEGDSAIGFSGMEIETMLRFIFQLFSSKYLSSYYNTHD